MKKRLITTLRYAAAVMAVTSALSYDAAGWAGCTSDTPHYATVTNDGQCPGGGGMQPCQSIHSGYCSLPLIYANYNCTPQNEVETLWQCSGNPCVANQVQVNYVEAGTPPCP